MQQIFQDIFYCNLKKINLPTDGSWGQKGNVLAGILRLKRCNINR